MKKELLQGVWPNEREVLARPHRLKYVRRLVKTKGCVFCEAAKAKKGPESLKLFQKGRWMVLLNKFPYNNGHLLILPKAHIADFDKLSSKDLLSMQILIKQSLKILKKVYQPHGFNTGMNLGAVAGAGIPDHLHFHIVPRWGGDTNFFPLIGETKLVVETNEQSYNSLRPHYKKLEENIAL